MKPSEVKEIVKFSLKDSRTPIFVWGAPGVGKSSVIRQVAEEEEVGFIDLRMTLLDPSDLRGLPFPKDGTAFWLPPSFLPKVERDGEKGILFLDELNAAPPLVQASGYQLVLDRKVGEYTLPPGWVVIGAGNRVGDRAVIFRMPSPLANRFVHLNFEVSLEDWVEWAVKNSIQPQVIGFINFRPSLLFSFNPERDDKAFPTPRSWAMASGLLSLRRELLIEALSGAVGEGTAGEFFAFLEMQEHLPPLEKIWEGEDIIPERQDMKYALVSALGIRTPEQYWNRLLQYSMKLPAEFAVLLAKLLVVRDKVKVAKLPILPQWSKKYIDLL